MNTENKFSGLPGSALKVFVGWLDGGGGGGGFHSIMWSHQLCIGLKLGCDNLIVVIANVTIYIDKDADTKEFLDCLVL